MGLVLGGIAILSATAAATLRTYLPTKPLQQYQLSQEEAAVFDRDSFSSNSLFLPSVSRPVNILVLGMSVLPSDVKSPPPETRNLRYKAQVHSVDGLSDTMLLLRFDPNADKLTILSIPRDTRIVTEQYGVQKINAANRYGGPALATKEVRELLLGVPIDRYVRVNVLAVGKIVDALGGLTINVPKDLKYTDESQHLYINLKKGEQHLNGDKVMQLLRFRNDRDADIGRIQRQQLVLRALMKQALNPAVIGKIPQLFEAIKLDVDTNLSIEEFMALASLSPHIDKDQLQTLTVPGNPNGNGSRSISYWLPDSDGIEAMMAKYFDFRGSGTSDNLGDSGQ